MSPPPHWSEKRNSPFEWVSVPPLSFDNPPSNQIPVMNFVEGPFVSMATAVRDIVGPPML